MEKFDRAKCGLLWNSPMKKGETRAAYQQRMAEENRQYVIRRLEADERLLKLQLENVRREIAQRQQEKKISASSR